MRSLVPVVHNGIVDATAQQRVVQLASYQRSFQSVAAQLAFVESLQAPVCKFDSPEPAPGHALVAGAESEWMGLDTIYYFQVRSRQIGCA